MRVFAKPGGIERLSLEARLVYTFFCLFMLLGVASSVWFWLDDHLGVTKDAAARYYLGGGEAPPATSDDAGGPELDLPAEAPLQLAKASRQVVETFHFHVFSASVCLLIVAHLFMMCGLSTRLKSLVIAAGGLSTLLHLLVPLGIRFVSAHLGALMFPSAVVMAFAWLWMVVQPLVEMWTRIPGRSLED